MTLLDKLSGEMRKAMKSQDKERLSTLRMLISAVRYALIDDPEMKEEKVLEVLRREAKKRRESIVAYRSGGRETQAKQEENELKIIGEFLPVEMSEDQIRKTVREVLEKEEVASFGEAMNKAMKTLRGKAEGEMVARAVKEVFNK